MIDKPLEDISSEDIQNLITNNVLERRTLEYKAELPDNSDNGKKEFLADVSSLANTAGGDLILGIKENTGVIEADYGLMLDNMDAQIARLENMIRDGLSPRIPVEIKDVSTQNDKAVLIIRVRSSLDSPHRVIYKAHDKFYARNSNGKYSMDVIELRNAFARTDSIAEKIRNFRTQRILEIKSDESTENNTPFVVIHLIPLSAFSSGYRMSADQLNEIRQGRFEPSLRPLYAGGWSHRINLLGVMAYSSSRGDRGISTYTQLYREGIIESADKGMLAGRDENKKLPMYAIEQKVIEYVTTNLRLLAALSFQPPIYFFLTLGNISGYTVMIPEDRWNDSEPMTHQDLLLPEAVINNHDDNIEQQLRPTFDMIWNASGVDRSLNFDADDNFIRR